MSSILFDPFQGK